MIAASSTLQELTALAASPGPEQSRRVAQEFEALLVAEMLRFGSKPMLKSGLLDGGSAGRMARDQFFAQLATQVAQGGGLGLARSLEAQLGADTKAGQEPRR